MQPRQITVPKSFFVSERDKFYSSWIEAFPREFVQNSVDAGARNLTITIEDAPSKGSFGKEPASGSVTRVTFEDDGTGMSRDVLENVFFALGESTKRDSEGSVGGFGRARIMQAFSQVRYSIRTRDSVVEGDGRDFDVVSPEEALGTLTGWAQAFEAQATAAFRDGDAARGERLNAAAELHRKDAERLRTEGANLKGCRFEVDLDPSVGDSHRRRPTVSRVREAFEDYFAQSEIRCRVTINGSEVSRPSRRMESRKKLTATMGESEIPDAVRASKAEILDRADGRKDVVFATLHSIRPADIRDGEKGRLNVRVRGASMFRESANSDDHALVLELAPGLARDVLTSNRDGMRSPYREAVEQFTRSMATDANKALDGRDNEEFLLLQGGQGRRIRARAAAAFEGSAPPPPRDADAAVVELSERTKRTDRYIGFSEWNWNKTVEAGLEGVPFDDLKTFFDSFGKGKATTFLEEHHDAGAVKALRQTFERRGLQAAMLEASGTMLGHIVDNLKYRRLMADIDKAAAYRDKMGDLNDVPILRKDMVPQEERYGEAERKTRKSALLQASRRFDPRNWDTETGKGKAPHQVLAAWTVMVDNAVDLLLKVQPKQAAFPYATGWTFSHKKYDYVAATRDYGWSNVGAKCMRPDKEDQTRFFLLNPLEDEEFKIAYNHRDPTTMSKLWALALHEVAHVASEDHDTTYAYVLTEMMQHVTPDFRNAMDREIKDRMSAVAGLYGKGRVRSAPMDDEPGPRPAERLLAGIAPDASLAARPDGGFEAEGDEAGRMIEEALSARAEEEMEPASPSFA